MKITNADTFRTNVKKKLNKIIRRKKLSLNLEKGIFNYTIQTARLRNIVRKWDNKAFVMIYVDKFKRVWVGTRDSGVFIFHPEEGIFEKVEIEGLTYVKTFFEDKNP